MKILVIDLITQKGHIKFVRNYLSLLNYLGEVRFISSKDYISKIGYNNCYVISNWFFNYNNKYEYVIKQVLLIILLSFKINKNFKNYKIIVTGFENISFFIAWRFISNKTYVVIHNNLTRGILSIYSFKRIKSNITFIALENYIKEFIESKYKKKTYFIPHPIDIINIKENRNLSDNIIFCPSGSSNFEEIDKFKNTLNNNSKLILIAKSNTEIINKNIIFKKYFDDYDTIFDKSKFIFIPFKYDYRVSGVFYESMNYNKIILTTKNSGLFIHQMKKLYPNSIFFIESFEDIEEINISNELKEKEYKKFISLHNNLQIFTEFKKMFLEQNDKI
ncbi:hypothetical protein [Tenuifilum osseticum]|uniref:hypothetical protein n=1 Tax=Tenuifilum osseticum TaxID=3374723 RepID=UPI0034E49171